MDKNDIIDVFTTATGPYKGFIPNFITSLVNFFPDNKKRLHIFLDDISNLPTPHPSIDVIPSEIIDLPFPMIPIQKTFIQSQRITADMKYVFYFDIDTIFLCMSNDTFDWLADMVDRGNVVLSRHPHYEAREFLLHYLVENNPDSKAYIPEEFNGKIISSFWGGRAKDVLKMCSLVNDMAKYDLWKLRYFPAFVDENYINKILWDYKKGNLFGIDFYTSEHLITLPGIDFSVDSPHVFLIQKYDNSIKSSKKDF